MIEYIQIEGFKSIRSANLKLGHVNVFIGSNGSGKSNFISFFKLLHAILNQQLQRFVIEEKADNLLYFGRKHTEQLYGKLYFTKDKKNNNGYWFKLAPTREGGLFIEEEGFGYNVTNESDYLNYFNFKNSLESVLPTQNGYRYDYLNDYLSNLQIYHFHDTSSTSMLRRACDINDNRFLRSDGRNLPAFLFLLKKVHPKIFARLERTIQSVAPYIDRLILEPRQLKPNEIELRWVDNGDLESEFSAYQFSDGTLRFIALATVLMQPSPPSVIIIDEPELGLHPHAISKLAGLIEAISHETQIIISTQSVNLVDCFSPDQVFAVDREDNQSVFQKLDSEKLQKWLEDSPLGELWERNIINSAQPFSK